MRRPTLLSLALLACTLSTTASAAGPTIFLDFESVATGPLTASELSGYGLSSVTGTGVAPGDVVSVRDMSNDTDLMISSGKNAFQPAGSYFPYAGISSTTIDFADGGLDSFSFTKIAEREAPYTYGITGWRVEAYDAANVLVDDEEDSFATGLDFPNPTILTYTLDGATPITRVIIRTNYNYQSNAGTVFMDDFTMVFVPEPAAASLVAAAACLLRRRR